MKLNRFLAICVIVLTISFTKAQEKCNYKDIMYTMIPNSKEQKFKKTNLDILQMDITPLLLNKMPYIGFIGKNKKRLDIRFSSIQKIKRGGYIAKGNSLVSNNKRDFEGVISIDTIFYFSKLCYGLEDEYKGDVKAQGIIVANYKFKEDDKLTATGTFEGKLLIRWYINSKNILLYDDIESYSDPYFNNAFIGTWTSYKTGKTQQCNWGQYRIPCAGDLDIGAGDFSPNKKYYKYGWEDYVP